MPNGIAVTRITPRNWKPEKTWSKAGSGMRKPKFATEIRKGFAGHATEVQAERVSSPRRSRYQTGDGDEPGGGRRGK